MKKQNKRVIIALLDSVGIGYAHDSKDYGDKSKGGDWGSNTVGHILQRYPNAKLTNLFNLGLFNAFNLSVKHNGTFDEFKLKESLNPTASYGFAVEVSKGKDTITGHWELMGCPLDVDWGYFTNPTDSFPKVLLDEIFKKARDAGININGSYGNCSASGTDIINKFGEDHMKSGLPIFYTSADSVLQIAAHEETFGLANLYTLCKIAREELYKYNIGRVIARPFVGNNPSNFKRTGNRKDYSITPPHPTLLNIMEENKGEVVAIGKISDIFCGSGITKYVKSSELDNLFNDTLKEVKNNENYSIIFTNFVNFDSDFGHRRDIKGYCEALEYFDSRLPELLESLQDNDLLVVLADHGNDPSWYGTDHTREHVPVLFYQKDKSAKSFGKLDTFADVAQSIASYLALPKLKFGKSVL